MKVTPVLIVPAIEPVLPLWESIGFARTAEVPHGDALGFVILSLGVRWRGGGRGGKPPLW